MNDGTKRTAGQLLGMPSILDKELEDRSGDAFGHQDFAIALRDLIEAPTNKPPFSIGLLGPWGTGKSSIKALYRRDLEFDKAGAVGNRRADRTHVITFNAWRFGGEQDLKRSLLREAFKQLGGDEATLRRALSEQVSKVTQERRSFKDWFGETFGQLIGSTVILLLLFVVAIAATWIFVWATGLKDQYSIGAVFVAATALTGWLGKTIVDLRLRSPALFLPQTSVSFPATSAEEYERLLTDQIAEFRRGVGKKCERLVVFVDDLDRLSAPEMVMGLDAIRTFLELPFNTSKNGFGVVFVISCDEDKIAEAIKRRSGLGSPDLPGAVFSRGDARRYLDRLFQYRLEIPQFPKLDMRDFARKKLEGIESVAGDLKKLKVSLEDVIDRLIHVDVQSPRNAIQLLNAFIQSWWIGSVRERNGVGSSAPGALHKGAVTNHPLSLAALCVLRVDFPDFYDAVQSRPEIIQEFRKVIFGGKSPSELAPQARELLRDFLLADKDGALTGEVRADHRKLRRYLSSLADLRWPVVLQPLLRLSEDPITRKFGDRAATVFDSLVSGDVVGVLEAFGRSLDGKPLADEDVVLLEDFGEALPQETETRRTNAARVLAALVDRIPLERRRRILSPLIRQMAALKTVRMNIQPERARQIVEGASPEDRRDVAEKFVDDLLNLEPLDWRLATGGEPNLDEVVGAVRDLVELALEVKEFNGLPSGADDMLRRWLLKREIRLGNESRTLPFSDLEGWAERHSRILPGYLASDYSDQAIGEFEGAKTAPTFTATVLPKISSIFADTAALGQDEREALWNQLTRLVGVQPQAAAEAAWGDAASYSSLAAPDKRRAFLTALAPVPAIGFIWRKRPRTGWGGLFGSHSAAVRLRVDRLHHCQLDRQRDGRLFPRQVGTAVFASPFAIWLAGRHHAYTVIPAISCFSPRAAMTRAPSASGRCSARASVAGPAIQRSISSCDLRITGIACGWMAPTSRLGAAVRNPKRSLVVSPSFTLRTEVHRVQIPAKHPSGRVSSRANQTGRLVPSGRCSLSEKLVKGTRQRCSGPSQRRQCGEAALRIFVTPGSQLRPFSTNCGDGMPHRAIVSSRPTGWFRTIGAA